MRATHKSDQQKMMNEQQALEQAVDRILKTWHKVTVCGRFLCVFLLPLCFMGCGSELDIPNQPLQGQINGESWTSELANAFQLPGGQIRARFLSELEPVADPCTLPSPGLAHVKAIFRPSLGDYNVAPVALDDNQVQVAFELSPSVSLTAVSGSMSIFDINNGIAVGFLQAQLDDDNQVEGVFTMSFCF